LKNDPHQTEQARQLEEDTLWLREEAIRIACSRTGRVVCTYDIATKTLTVPEEYAREQNIPVSISNYPDCLQPEKADGIELEQENIYAFYQDILRGVPSGSYEMPYFHKEKGVLWKKWEYMLVRDKAGVPRQAVIIVEDVTQRYRDQIERAGLTNLTDTIFVEILFINLTRENYRIIRYDQATTLGTAQEGPLLQMLQLRLENIHPDDQALFRKHFFPEGLKKAISEGDKRLQLTYRRRGVTEQAPWRWIETTVVQQENPYNKDIILFAASRNVDEEKSKETNLLQQVRQQTEELNITMNQISDYISYYDVRTRVLTTVPSTAKIFGIPTVLEDYPESFIANAPAGYPVETGERLRAFIEAIHRGEPRGSCDYPTVTADGQPVWLHREFVTIFDDDGAPVRAVIVSKDIGALAADPCHRAVIHHRSCVHIPVIRDRLDGESAVFIDSHGNIHPGCDGFHIRHRHIACRIFHIGPCYPDRLPICGDGGIEIRRAIVFQGCRLTPCIVPGIIDRIHKHGAVNVRPGGIIRKEECHNRIPGLHDFQLRVLIYRRLQQLCGLGGSTGTAPHADLTHPWTGVRKIAPPGNGIIVHLHGPVQQRFPILGMTGNSLRVMQYPRFRFAPVLCILHKQELQLYKQLCRKLGQIGNLLGRKRSRVLQRSAAVDGGRSHLGDTGATAHRHRELLD